MSKNTEVSEASVLENVRVPDAEPESAPRGRPRADSYIRFRAQATGFTGLLRRTVDTALARAANPSQDTTLSFLEELGDEQLTLTVNLLCLEHVVDGIPYDASARAAGQSLRERIQELSELRNALNIIYLDASDPRMALMITGDAPLGDYLRGVYAWTKGVIRTIEDLASGLRTLTTDWSSARLRLQDAREFFLDDLEFAIHKDLARLRLRAPELNEARDPLAELDEHLEELFWAASYLAKGLEKKFG